MSKRKVAACLWGLVALFGGIALQEVLKNPLISSGIALICAIPIPYLLRDDWVPVIKKFVRQRSLPLTLGLTPPILFGRPEFSFLLPEIEKVKDKKVLFGYANLHDKEQFPLTLTLPCGQWIVMTQWLVEKQIKVQEIQQQFSFSPDNGSIRIVNQDNPYITRETNGDYIDWHGNLHTRGSFPRAFGPNYCHVSGYRIEVTDACHAKLRFVVTIEGQDKFVRELDFYGVVIGSETMRSGA